MADSLSLGLLILRLVAGLTIARHGAQKLFGWFGGDGFSETTQLMQAQGFKPASFWTGLGALGEFGGGLSLALGFLTPLGAAAAFAVMLLAVAKFHWKNGFSNARGGFEYPLSLMAVSVALGFTGPGSYSLDALLGIARPAPLLFGVLALAALLVDVIGILISRPVAATPPEPRPAHFLDTLPPQSGRYSHESSERMARSYASTRLAVRRACSALLDGASFAVWRGSA
jgi:putative oxidoreductase